MMAAGEWLTLTPNFGFTYSAGISSVSATPLRIANAEHAAAASQDPIATETPITA
jgi:hypothetical protein